MSNKDPEVWSDLYQLMMYEGERLAPFPYSQCDTHQAGYPERQWVAGTPHYDVCFYYSFTHLSVIRVAETQKWLVVHDTEGGAPHIGPFDNFVDALNVYAMTLRMNPEFCT